MCFVPCTLVHHKQTARGLVARPGRRMRRVCMGTVCTDTLIRCEQTVSGVQSAPRQQVRWRVHPHGDFADGISQLGKLAVVRLGGAVDQRVVEVDDGGKARDGSVVAAAGRVVLGVGGQGAGPQRASLARVVGNTTHGAPVHTSVVARRCRENTASHTCGAPAHTHR